MVKTQKEFVDEWMHEFFGMVCDTLAGGYSGDGSSRRLLQIRGKIEEHLRKIYDSFCPPNRPGQAPGPPVKK